MLSTSVAKELELSTAIEQALVGGDLSKLTLPQRLEYYKAVCASLKLNPLTKPFIYISLNGKLVLYPTGDCADQLRAIHGVSITRLDKKTEDGIYEVTAYASLPNGRTDQSAGLVYIENLKGADRANAKMKTETKAKRRVTMSLVGLSGFMGIELSDEQVAQYKDIDPSESPVISAREAATLSERSAHPLTEWTEELDVTPSMNTPESDAPTGPLSQTHVVKTSAESIIADPLALLRRWEIQLATEYTAKPPGEEQMKRDAQQIVFALKATDIGDDADLRHALKRTLFGTNEITPAQRTAMRKWLGTDTAKQYIAAFVRQETASETQPERASA